MQFIIGGITKFHESRRACCTFFLRLHLCVIEYLVRLKSKNTFQKRSRRILNRGVNSFLKLGGGKYVVMRRHPAAPSILPKSGGGELPPPLYWRPCWIHPNSFMDYGWPLTIFCHTCESNNHSVQKCCNKWELVKCDWEIFYMNWICMSSHVNDMWHVHSSSSNGSRGDLFFLIIVPSTYLYFTISRLMKRLTGTAKKSVSSTTTAMMTRTMTTSYAVEKSS